MLSLDIPAFTMDQTHGVSDVNTDVDHLQFSLSWTKFIQRLYAVKVYLHRYKLF